MSFDNTDRNESPKQRAESGSSGPRPALIAFIVVVALAAVFFFQNGETTSIDFLVFEANTTIRWSIIMAVLFGVLLDRLFSMWWRRRKKRKLAAEST